MPNLPLGSPAIIQVPCTGPGAGNDFILAVPPALRWQILSVAVRLDTDATVANRTVFLHFGRGALTMQMVPSDLVQTASLTRNYYFIAGRTEPNALFLSNPLCRLPAGIVLDAQHNIQIIVDNGAAGDLLTSIYLYVLEWLVP